MTGKGKKDKLKQDKHHKHQKHQKESHEKKLNEKELGKIHGGGYKERWRDRFILSAEQNCLGSFLNLLYTEQNSKTNFESYSVLLKKYSTFSKKIRPFFKNRAMDRFPRLFENHFVELQYLIYIKIFLANLKDIEVFDHSL